MYDHVLVGTDGSPTATKAVEVAARLAQVHCAKLTVVHAFDSRPIVETPPIAASLTPSLGTSADAPGGCTTRPSKRR